MKEQMIRKWTALLLMGMTLLLMIVFVVLDKKEFSENENRYLAKFPAFEWGKIRSGEFMEGLESYTADHFPFRDFFMGIKTQTEMLAGKKEINDIYIAKDGYLIEEYQKPENTERIGNILKTFAGELEGEELEIRLMLVPTAVYVYEDKLPEYAPRRNQMETAEQIYDISGIERIDCSQDLLAWKASAQGFDEAASQASDAASRQGFNQASDAAFRQGDGGLYYRTDHHWTTLGAYVGYTAFCREMGLEAIPLEEMDARTATEDFRGTVYSKAGDYTRKGDVITIYTNPLDRLTVKYVDTEETSDSLYNLDYAEVKDKYSLFLDNLHSLIEIDNETADSERELVLVKDSYANSMVPFLVRHYKKIYVFDTRYYKQGVSEFVKGHPGVTDVLILYNMNTLDTDLGIRGVY